MKKEYLWYFSWIYVVLGACLTVSNFIIFKVDVSSQSPFLIFPLSFFIFWLISKIFKIYLSDLNKLDSKNNIFRINFFFTLIILIFWITYIIVFTTDIFQRYGDIGTVKAARETLSGLNKIIFYILIGIPVLIILSDLNSKRDKIFLKIKLLIISSLTILSIIPISMFLEFLIRIVGFAIGLAGGLWKTKKWPTSQ